MDRISKCILLECNHFRMIDALTGLAMASSLGMKPIGAMLFRGWQLCGLRFREVLCFHVLFTSLDPTSSSFLPSPTFGRHVTKL